MAQKALPVLKLRLGGVIVNKAPQLPKLTIWLNGSEHTVHNTVRLTAELDEYLKNLDDDDKTRHIALQDRMM